MKKANLPNDFGKKKEREVGQGNWYRWNSKSTEENYHIFTIASLRKAGFIREGSWRHGTSRWSRNSQTISTIAYEINMRDAWPWLRVHYTNTRTKEPYDYKIYLTSTTPNYGGNRWWFLCPGQNCNRRVGVLYLGTVMLCRHCLRMAYSSQNQMPYDRQTDRAFKLASKLGLDGNVFDGFYGPKPKGMHWKTYHRKVAEIERLSNQGLRGAVARFGIWF